MWPLLGEHGYVKTLKGRRRYLRDIDSRNAGLRGHAERNAINAPVQGSAADLIKLAMIDIDRLLMERKLQSKMLLQVHDELVFDVPSAEREEVEVLVKEAMQNAMPGLDVPLQADLGWKALVGSSLVKDSKRRWHIDYHRLLKRRYRPLKNFQGLARKPLCA